MTYLVKEIYYTLQGEGAQTGRPAVFLRFAGCNLWSGREQDREKAVCRFCDTDFRGMDGPGGGKFVSPGALAAQVAFCWPGRPVRLRDRSRSGAAQAWPGALVVCTGGEPLMQLDLPLIGALRERGFEVAVETNGTLAAPEELDWICVSPKAGTDLVQRSGDELKLVFPQADFPPESFEGLDFRHFLLQPMDGPDMVENTKAAVRFCLERPLWKLSLQTHKILGLP